MSHPDQINLTRLRYVLYARKSTEDENRQVRSIDDQIRDCQKLASSQGLRVVEVIKETKSAKKPSLRPEFMRMMQGIGKNYDAILCWHPDRLARNMLEGGQIINLLDEGELKDIRFHSHQFSNDANGKMLLGMLFVFSKQYSDDLSAKVSRGVRGNFNEGKSAGTPKIGYTRSEVNGCYESNEFFDAMCEAWRRRAKGESLESITEYLLNEGVHRVTKNARRQRILRPTKSTISNVFHDPFYYGLLVQAGQSVDLCQVMPSFTPATDEETYNRVQAISYGRTKGMADKKRATFYPLHGFIYCAVCHSDKHMIVGKNKTGSGKHVLSYRCDNKVCTRNPKSLRAKHIFNALYDKLGALKVTDEAYKRYSAEIDGRTDEKIIAIKQDMVSRQGALNHIQKEIRERTLSAGRLDEASSPYRANMKALEDLTAQELKLEDKIKALREKVADPGRIKLNKEEFLNLLKTAADKMRAGSAVEKDALCRVLFLNLRVDNEKVASYHWREPFATLVRATEIKSGGPGWI